MANALEYIEKFFVYVYDKILAKFPEMIVSFTVGVGDLIENFTVGFGQGFSESLGI